jgi:hypothetical protein
MKQVLFISEQKIKAYTAISDNVQVQELVPYIIQAQEINIQPIIGSKLYTKLQQDILADTVTGNYKTLLEDYISQTVVNFGFYNALPFIKYKVVGNGLVSGSSETSSDTQLAELKYIRQTVLDSAEFYAERLRKFLSMHLNEFREYAAPDAKGLMPQHGTQYFSGLHTPKRNYINDGTYENPDCYFPYYNHD